MRTGSHHVRLPPASSFSPGVAPLVRRGFLLAGGGGPRQPKALASGGSEAGSARDYGFMYQRSFRDPDGHTFEIFYMNEAEFPGN